MTGGNVVATVLQTNAIAAMMSVVARVIASRSYHFVIAAWRAKRAYSKYDHRPVALRIELVHKVDNHLIFMRLMIRE